MLLKCISRKVLKSTMGSRYSFEYEYWYGLVRSLVAKSLKILRDGTSQATIRS